MSDILYYKVVCRRFPAMIAAKHHLLDSYVYDFSRQGAWCEVGFVQTGRIREYREDREWCHEAGSVYTFATPAPLRHYAETQHEEIVLEMRINEWKPVTREEILSWQPKAGEFLLKNKIDDPFLCRTLEKLIKQGVELYNGRSPLREQLALSVMLEILAKISEHVIHEISAGDTEISPRNNEYCRLACAYIRQHLSQKLALQDVAEHVGLSYSRLSHVFRQVKGITLVEYINREKIFAVQRLLTDERLAPEVAGIAVGIDDVKYLRRLFRKYTGMTITQYIKMH